MQIFSKKRFIVFAFFLAIAFGAGFFLVRSIKNSGSAKLPFSKANLAASQKEETAENAKYTTTKSDKGIDVRLTNQADFGITFPKTLVEPIIIPLPGNRSVEIIDQSADNKKAELISADKISSNQQNSKLLDIIQKDPNLAAYQTESKDKTIFYAYQGNPSGEGRGKFKNWILYAEGNGSETESYLIQKAKVILDQNGNAKIYADDETNDTNQNPDFTIPKPYFIDKDGKHTDLNWELDENANTLTVKITTNQNQYPLILDPTIEFDATIFSIKGTFKTYGTVNLGKGRPFYCGDNVQGLSPDVLTYGTVWGADGKCWLDRNLGATQVATSSTDAASYGWYYQWGRLTDGHQIGTSGTTATLATSDTPGHANFITNSSGNYDWRNPQNANLWQGLSGINNPCPTGFRLPTSAEWSTLIASSPAITNAATAFSSTLKIPVAGLRISGGSLSNQGSTGWYWASSASSTESWYLTYSSSSASVSTVRRVNGQSVRCVRDVTPPARPAASALFNFTDQTGVNPSTLTTSDIKQITGLSAAAAVSISGDGSPEYRICGDSACSSVDHTWSSSAGSIDNNQYLQLRLTSNASCSTTNYATVMVGDGSNKWSVKTGWFCGCSVTYNGDIYSTVQLGSQCWFRENLRTTKAPDGVTSITRYCYTGDSNCTNTTSGMIYGGMYDWATATNQASSCNTTSCPPASPYQGICPTGWHIPTDAEWSTLAGSYSVAQLLTVSTSTFSGILAGYYSNGGFYNRGPAGGWWSSTEYSASAAWNIYLISGNPVSYVNFSKTFGFSVRCLKN